MRCSSRYARIFYQANEGERKGAHQGIRAPARGQYHLDKCNARTNCVKKRSNRAEKAKPYTLKTRNVLLCFLITFFLSKWYWGTPPIPRQGASPPAPPFPNGSLASALASYFSELVNQRRTKKNVPVATSRTTGMSNQKLKPLLSVISSGWST